MKRSCSCRVSMQLVLVVDLAMPFVRKHVCWEAGRVPAAHPGAAGRRRGILAQIFPRHSTRVPYSYTSAPLLVMVHSVVVSATNVSHFLFQRLLHLHWEGGECL